MNWYIEVLKKYAVFDGRARRKEFWFFVLFNIIISAVLAIVDNVIGSSVGDANVGFLGGIYSLAVLIPSIAVTVRRLHDTERSGWWILLSFVPFGVIVVLVFALIEGTAGPNKYGEDPKGRSAAYAGAPSAPQAPPAASWDTAAPTTSPPPPPPSAAPPQSTAQPPAAQPASTTTPPPATTAAPPPAESAAAPAETPASSEEPPSTEPPAPPAVSPPTPPPLTPPPLS
ncbi:MAG: DUF805 domain-containing protein [Thermoleophilia bacterium]|jgi:uncharacterized membrane protein YhaH (DUF805 family)|nr:DUF805 domain-containing protein [Thermoleophilia bacterium]